MRRLRAAVVLLFIVSVIAFAAYQVLSRLAQDNRPPEITCDSDTLSISVESEDSELLKGVKAEDNRDGDLTDSVRVSSMSNFTEPGKRTITYAVFDKANNAATMERTLEYTDYTSPKITLTEPLRFDISDMEDASLTEHMKAEDCLDGDITSQIRATYNDSAYVSQAGDYNVTVQVSNSAGDTCTVPLTVTVTDSSSDEERGKYYPALSQYIVYTPVGEQVDLAALITGVTRGGSEYAFGEPGAPESPEGVSISGDVDYGTEGTYTVEYSYTPEGGVTATTRLTVVVG